MVGVAGGFEGGDAGAVFGPLVGPEGVVVAFVVFPVGGHVGEEVGFAEGGDDGGDVGVGAGGVAVCVVGAVAAVGPGDGISMVLHVGEGGEHTKDREASTNHPAPSRAPCPKTASAAAVLQAH